MLTSTRQRAAYELICHAHKQHKNWNFLVAAEATKPHVCISKWERQTWSYDFKCKYSGHQCASYSILILILAIPGWCLQSYHLQQSHCKSSLGLHEWMTATGRWLPTSCTLQSDMLTTRILLVIFHWHLPTFIQVSRVKIPAILSIGIK